jgi:DNA-binding transcriptional ArsR family regulator
MEIYENPGVLGNASAMERLAKGLLGFGHPTRVRCLVLLADEHSPSDLYEVQQQRDDAGEIIEGSGPSLGTVSYHMRMLRDYGLIREVRVQPRRGALEHFYVRTDLADEILAALAPVFELPRVRRSRNAIAA